MKSVIIDRSETCMEIPEELLRLFPYRVSDAIRSVRSVGEGKLCEEIRLRCGRVSALTITGGITLPLNVRLTRDEMDQVVDNLCGGSLYAHGDTIKKGYVAISGGMRAGICGRAATENGKIIGVGEISSVNIRIPHIIKVDPQPVCRLLSDMSYSKGVLIYSPPGEGKTTLLRSVASWLSRVGNTPSLRVVVVDSREELEFGLNLKNCTADVLSGYPKSEGIEIALRTMNADVIICDEIGNEEDAKAICDAANGGAALVASAHASDISSLMRRKSIRLLHESGVFGGYVGLRRKGNDITVTVTRENEAENVC